MSASAIRDVTRALHDLIASQLASGRKVTLLPPGDDPPSGGSGVNLYMYRVNESPQLKNQPYPGDRAGAPASAGPALSLELFYLLTPYGPPPDADHGEDESHRALGEAMLALHEHPVLNRTHVPGFDADVSLPAYLLDSFEDVKVRLHPVSLDELAKIWGTIGKPYRLSVAYEVTLVQLTPVVPPGVSAGVVERTGVDVVQLAAPRLTGLTPVTGPLATLVGGQVRPGQVTVTGFGLAARGEDPAATAGGAPAAIAGVPTDRQLTLVLPDRPPVGPALPVVVRLARRASRPLDFTASPWASSMTPLRTALDPGVPGDVTLTVAGSGLAGAAGLRIAGASGAVDAGPPGAGSDAGAVVVAAPAGLANGSYEVRARMPGGELTNPRTLEVIPRLDDVAYDTGTATLTLAGARLDGGDARLEVDGVEFSLGRTTDGARLVRVMARPLGPGQHTVAVTVDGHASRARLVTV